MVDVPEIPIDCPILVQGIIRQLVGLFGGDKIFNQFPPGNRGNAPVSFRIDPGGGNVGEVLGHALRRETPEAPATV
jgi:hypothetical protein